MRIKTGTYLGTGVDNLPITGLPWKPEALFIKGVVSGPFATSRVRTASMPSDSTKQIGNQQVLVPDVIQSFDTSGFTVGAHDSVNRSGGRYYYLALRRSVTNDLAIFAYEGNGADNRNIVIPNTAFQPDLVIIICAGSGHDIWWKTAQMPAGDNSEVFDLGGPYSTNRIQAINSDGFQIGSNGDVNQSGVCYHCICAKIAPNRFNIFHYTGDGLSPRDISIGLQPTFVNILCQSFGNFGAIRFKDETGSNSTCWDAVGGGEASTWITSLLASAFRVGSSNDRVNANTKLYDGFAFADGDS